MTEHLWRIWSKAADPEFQPSAGVVLFVDGRPVHYGTLVVTSEKSEAKALTVAERHYGVPAGDLSVRYLCRQDIEPLWDFPPELSAAEIAALGGEI